MSRRRRFHVELEEDEQPLALLRVVRCLRLFEHAAGLIEQCIGCLELLAPRRADGIDEYLAAARIRSAALRSSGSAITVHTGGQRTVAVRV
jgi:hypothetical protein